MKNVKITKFSHAEVDGPKEPFGYLRIPLGHKEIRAEGEELEVSDGYHTFDELYEHRIALFRALCRACFAVNLGINSRNSEHYIPIWRAKEHHDGTSYEGWFIAGIEKKPGDQISYHIPMDKWDDFDFCETLERAPEWDGHTPEDVIQRLKRL